MRQAGLQVSGLSFHQPHAQLFTDWSATFPPGLTWVTGEEGTGKTSLLRLLSGDWPVSSGSVRWLEGEAQQALVPADVYWVDPAASARDELTVHAFASECQSRYPGWSQTAFKHWVKTLSLSEHVDKFLYMLSTGSKRKVWLAGALAANAE